MTWGLVAFANRLRRSAILSRAIDPTAENTARSGPADSTAQRSRDNGVMLSVRREILCADLRRMKPTDPRRGRLNSELRALTTQMLRGA